MKRVMVNLDDEAGRILLQKARNEGRSASAYLLRLVEADLRAAGLLPEETEPVSIEQMAKLKEALARHPDLLPQIEKLINERRRKHRRAA